MTHQREGASPVPPPVRRRCRNPVIRFFNGTRSGTESYGSLNQEFPMNGIIYLIGLIVVVLFILSLLGLA
jgi:hypothetical protein